MKKRRQPMSDVAIERWVKRQLEALRAAIAKGKKQAGEPQYN